MRRRFRFSRCPFNPGLECFQSRNECAKCERRIRSGQKTLFELVSKPAGERYEGKVGRRWRKPSRALESVGLPPVKPIAFPTPKTQDLAPLAGCRSCPCSLPHRSQIMFVCPVDGSWRWPADRCKFAEYFKGVYGRKPVSEELKIFCEYLGSVRALHSPKSMAKC